MRTQTGARLRPFAPRFRVDSFDLASTAWLPHLQSADCVLSSLCIHHLPGREKQRLFEAIFQQLSPRGALLIADLIAPQRPEARSLFAATWNQLAEAQSVQQTGSGQLFAIFQKERWNHYQFPDPVDQPSPLFDQLLWLKAAGFAIVDCFWLQAGHAIYGGYKTPIATASHPLSFETALRSAHIALTPSGLPSL
jgi:SAM-dependent methyltransferase